MVNDDCGYDMTRWWWYKHNICNGHDDNNYSDGYGKMLFLKMLRVDGDGHNFIVMMMMNFNAIDRVCPIPWF